MPDGQVLLTDVILVERIRIICNETVGAIVDDFAEITQAVQVVVSFEEHPLALAVRHGNGFVAGCFHPFVRHHRAH